MKRIESHHLPFRFISPPDNKHYFFGYYNLCPWAADQRKVLSHQSDFADRLPQGGEAVRLGFLDSDSGTFSEFASSYAWNFQQGAKLQWMRKPDTAERILHNDFRDNRLCTVIRNAGGEELGSFSHPVYTVSPTGREAIGFSFDRINSCRPEYGYPVLPDRPHLENDDQDGVWRIDFETGERILLVSIRQLKSIHPCPTAANARHYCIHAVYNRSGSRLLFLHRYERTDGITQTRLFTVGADGADLRLLLDGMVSHFDWLDDETIFAWAGRRSMLADQGFGGPTQKLKRTAMKGLKPVYYALGKPRFLMVRVVGDSYHIIPDRKAPEIRPFAKGLFLTDGHCTFNRGGRDPNRWLLTDGYPDRRFHLPLYLCDLENDRAYELGSFPCPPQFEGAIRVDLHPRFSLDAGQVCIDLVREGKRAMALIDVSSLTNNGMT